MNRRKTDPKLVMLEHSQAKIELYGRYLSRYLNILGHVPTIEKVYIFDLLCGEGIYENKVEGSPCIALNSIKGHYFSQDRSCSITIWFNDNGLSEIDEGIYKVQRVERLCKKRFVPPNVNIEYYREDFGTIYLAALKKVQSKQNIKGLFFIDPYGYKAVQPQHIKKILESGNTETILFLPVSHMYRFAERSVQTTTFSGGEPLRDFLIELFQSTDLRFNSVYDFVNQVKEQFRSYLSKQGVFVDTFTLERDKHNVYCLFFFTSHIKGFEKMLETKWQMDKNQGRGFTLEKTLPLFNNLDVSDYPQKLMDFIKESEYRTNEEIYEFGLLNGYLPKHTNIVLKKWKKEQPYFEVFSLDDNDSPVRGFYINSKPKRRVGLRFRR